MTMRHGQDYFPLATRYAPRPCPDPGLLREPGARGRVFEYTERHVQAVWYDPRWRPTLLKSHRGEDLEVESPGHWNLEAGPDFIGAALRVGPDRRRITGDVEVHVFPSGWNQHGHRQDPRYRKVCLHLTYYEGSLPAEVLPAGALQASLRTVLKTDPTFAFEQVDVTAYPYAGRADVPPCRIVMNDHPPAWRAGMLEAAGHERMRRKAERFAAMIAERGIDQVFYEQVLAALGYQHNKQPMLELAARLPVDLLRTVAQGRPDQGYALLAGASGLLPGEVKKTWDDETRRWLRGLWDTWWRMRDQLPAPMSRAAWRLQGLRPLNHPLRRLAAAAQLFVGGGEGLARLESWLQGDAVGLVDRMMQDLAGTTNTYWARRASPGGKISTTPLALLGEDRALALSLNVVIPLAAACGFAPTKVNALLEHLRPEGLNNVIRQTSYCLLGPDAPSALLASANRRQGLQQIFHDYCLGDRSRCAACPFPDVLRQAQHLTQN